MPKFPNTVSWRDVEFIAKQIGFEFKRHDGTSHRHYKKEGLGILTIPTYKEMSVNQGHLFSSMLRQMGIKKANFFAILNEK